MVTTKQKSRTETQKSKKEAKETDQIIVENHQLTKVDKNVRKKKQWRDKITRR